MHNTSDALVAFILHGTSRCPSRSISSVQLYKRFYIQIIPTLVTLTRQNRSSAVPRVVDSAHCYLASLRRDPRDSLLSSPSGTGSRLRIRLPGQLRHLVRYLSVLVPFCIPSGMLRPLLSFCAALFFFLVLTRKSGCKIAAPWQKKNQKNKTTKP